MRPPPRNARLLAALDRAPRSGRRGGPQHGRGDPPPGTREHRPLPSAAQAGGAGPVGRERRAGTQRRPCTLTPDAEFSLLGPRSQHDTQENDAVGAGRWADAAQRCVCECWTAWVRCVGQYHAGAAAIRALQTAATRRDEVTTMPSHPWIPPRSPVGCRRCADRFGFLSS